MNGAEHASCDHEGGICFILPPHILKHIVETGNDAQRGKALETISVSGQIRGARAIRAAIWLAVPAGEKRRTTYDAKRGRTLPGALARAEGGRRVRDTASNEAHDGAGTVYDFFAKAFDRNSIDGHGHRLDSTVHYDRDYDNAFWDGQQMVYGDGDGQLFNRFTVSLDIIGHELGHGVIQYEAGLEYRDQPGALNESMADVFGSLVKQWKGKQTAAKADWIIGAGLLTKRVKGIGLRSMKAPGTAYDDPVLGKDPQPAHMRDLYKGREDNGGVHVNSGIPNHAFYLCATALGGYAWERAGKIWYRALCDRLKPLSEFSDARRATIAVATDLYGRSSREVKAVQAAWKQVGVT